MLKSPYLFAVGVLLTLLSWMAFDAQVKAEETKLALSFDLSPVGTQVAQPPVEPLPAVPTVPEPAAPKPILLEGNYDSLPVPTAPIPVSSTALASKKLEYAPPPLPPISGESVESQPTKKDIGLSFAADEVAVEDPSPKNHEPVISQAVDSQFTNSETTANALTLGNTELGDMQLSFAPTDLETALDSIEIETVPNEPTADQASVSAGQVSFESFGLGDWIFQDGSDSLVARTVGSAEGTRHWSGDRTIAYYGHVDPGNGVWNLGTFSYQHGANSPEEADEKQLRRLKRQGSQLEAQAKDLGLELSLEEKLNALDLANQAPLAALDRGGYMERLAQARRLEMKGEEAILWARTYAYLDPDTRAWNAPGLGNNIRSISKDQERRIDAISKALKAFDPSGGKSDSLDNLQNISLENTEPTLSSKHQSPPDPSELSNIAASFELPASTAALSDSDLVSTNSVSTTQVVPDPVEQPLEERTPAEQTPAEQVSAADELGVAFSPTASLTSTVQAEREASITSETIEAEAQETNTVELPSTDEANLFDLKVDAADTDVISRDVVSQDVVSEDPLESQEVALTQDSNIDDTNTSESITETVADGKTRQERLSNLIEGIIPRNQSSDDIKEATNTEATNTKATDTEATVLQKRSLWRVEDKVLPQK
ncbi:MAG: hypothetical protein AAF716_11540 [Cyanobacteria bacterium P01_D01_bin.1]